MELRLGYIGFGWFGSVVSGGVDVVWLVVVVVVVVDFGCGGVWW